MILGGLIPSSVFQASQSWLLWVLLFASVPILAVGADVAVGGAVRLAKALGMSKVIIGATIVSLGTTAPETFTSVTAALQGAEGAGLALGNAVGSVICDTALVFGVCCLMTRLPLNRFILYRHGVLKLASGALLTLIVFSLAAAKGGFVGVLIPRWVGVGLLALLGGYLYISVRWARQHPEIVPQEAEVKLAHLSPAGRTTINVLRIVIGLGLVVGGSNLLVGSVLELAQNRYSVDPDLLAVTVVAFGTSLPELVTAVTAVRKGHGDLAIGNVIGADILNVLFVVGASATFVPLEVPVSFFVLHLPVMMASLGLMGAYIFANRRSFQRWQGLPLLGMYAAYLLLLLMRLRGGGAG